MLMHIYCTSQQSQLVWRNAVHCQLHFLSSIFVWYLRKCFLELYRMEFVVLPWPHIAKRELLLIWKTLCTFSPLLSLPCSSFKSRWCVSITAAPLSPLLVHFWRKAVWLNVTPTCTRSEMVCGVGMFKMANVNIIGWRRRPLTSLCKFPASSRSSLGKGLLCIGCMQDVCWPLTAVLLSVSFPNRITHPWPFLVRNWLKTTSSLSSLWRKGMPCCTRYYHNTFCWCFFQAWKVFLCY